jgi:hypothetical protein
VGYLTCMIQHMSCIKRPVIKPQKHNKEQIHQELLIELQTNNNSSCVIYMSYDVFSQLVIILYVRGLFMDSQYNATRNKL